MSRFRTHVKVVLRTFNRDCLWTKFYIKTLFVNDKFVKLYLFLKLHPFPFHVKIYRPNM